jgi:hypothetical protein
MPDPHLERARHLVAESLTRLSGQWTVDGDLVRGPGTTAVVLAELHGAAPAHLDLGFVLNRERADTPVIWDCAAGIGATEEAKLRRAVETWATCTAPVVLELLTQKGRFADHYQGDDPDGFAGWHAIHGPWLGWGTGDGPNELQRWALDHPLLPLLRSPVRPELDRAELNGVKILFGASPTGETAEVRINGTARPGPSTELLALGWPRPAGHAYVRAFVLLVHEDNRAP